MPLLLPQPYNIQKDKRNIVFTQIDILNIDPMYLIYIEFLLFASLAV